MSGKIATFVRLHGDDNVVVATANLPSGTSIEGNVLNGAIPFGHKVATTAITVGEAIRKYGQTIGFASQDIRAAEHVHDHNCEFASAAKRTLCAQHDTQPTNFVAPGARATFNGFVRADGRVGTRNFIAVLSTVNCAATVAKKVAAHFDTQTLEHYPNVDGVCAFTHAGGCGMAMESEGFDLFQRILAGYATHPNFAGVLLIGLGCEVMQIRYLMDAYGLEDGTNFHHMNIQDTGGTRKTVEDGIRRIEAMLPQANTAVRQNVSAEHLILGLQCGGSNGYSGITANPALGMATDLVVRHGGTAILAETPELFGAEHLLTRRAQSPEIAQKLMDRIHWWEDYVARNNGSMDNNPSPGNKLGGLSTILEKSLGAVAKGGTTNLVDVYAYGEPITKAGLVFMDSPGYDPVSITGEIASGATVVCFSTGRGSVSGYKPVPCLKLATNTEMFERMREDMDINCGTVLSEGLSLENMGERIFRRILDAASGQRTKSETLGYGDSEFTPWIIGAVM